MAIVTISRQVGSLGDEIAQALAEDLGYRLVGEKEHHLLAGKYDPEFTEKLERFEKEQGPGFFERLFFSTPIYLSLYQALVYELAGERRVVILGRGAQIVLKDIHQVYRVRVVAPMECRVERISRAKDMNVETARDFVKKYDHRRRALIRQVFDHDPMDFELYDMFLNTYRMDVAAGVAIIKSAVEEVRRLQPVEEATNILMALALGKRVEAKIRTEFPGRAIEVKGELNGLMLLTGELPSGDDTRAAEEVALAYPGVTGVVNNLRTTTFAYGF
ncbi:MAG: cytidylate kinase family protein [Deltaproteobacteria bacterium]|nr:cytidylate kinase family protein [Deltaproteobacteria bacterium]